MKPLYHTPDGVRDIYNSECTRQQTICNKIHERFMLYGYADIKTPTIEFFDVFRKERGSVAGNDMYKFFDREGNTLVLRPDMTPPIARSAATYYKDERCPVRLCYVANSFINNSGYKGKLNEYMQAGAEVIGDHTVECDAELIALSIDCFKSVGLLEFQICIGQIGFFEGLVEEAGLDESLKEQLKNLVVDKNFFALEQVIQSQSVEEKSKQAFLALPYLMGGKEILKKARTLTENEKALEAIKRLEALSDILDDYGVSEYISFDLGMQIKYNYYTGIIIKGYSYGSGEPVLTGGRYDKLMEQFGKQAAAVGFAIYVDELMSALSRQKIEIDTGESAIMILYDKESRKQALNKAKEMRDDGRKVQLILKDKEIPLSEYRSFADKSHITEIIYLKLNNMVDEWSKV